LENLKFERNPLAPNGNGQEIVHPEAGIIHYVSLCFYVSPTKEGRFKYNYVVFIKPGEIPIPVID